MPSRFASGSQTNRYDQVVPVDVIDGMATVNDRIDQLEKSIDTRIQTEHNSLISEVNQELGKMNHELTTSIQNVDSNTQYHIRTILLQFYHFLNFFYRIPIIRFINLFTRWYTVDKITKHVIIHKFAYKYTEYVDLDLTAAISELENGFNQL